MQIRVGTRGSQLAKVQTDLVVSALADFKCEKVEIKTTGDSRQGSLSARVLDKREWIHEIEAAVVSGSIDLAVHSAKDVPVDIHPETVVTSLLPRGPAHDVLVLREGDSLNALPEGALIGTSSLRRRAQLLQLRSDLLLTDNRGNVPTRLRKLGENSELSGIVLAAAGLERLGQSPEHCCPFDPHEFLPAVCQGTLAVQYRADSDIGRAIGSVIDFDTQVAFLCEREFVRTLGADCRAAVGVFAEVTGGEVTVTGAVFSIDGSKGIRDQETGSISDATNVGRRLAMKLLEEGADVLLKAI